MSQIILHHAESIEQFPHAFFQAAQYAAKSTFRKQQTETLVRIGSILYSGAKLIGGSYNQDEHTWTEQHYLYHAEVRNINRLLNKLYKQQGPNANPMTTSKMTLYVVHLANRPGYFWKNAKPCQHCEKVIRSVNINRIFYSINDTTYGEMRI